MFSVTKDLLELIQLYVRTIDEAYTIAERANRGEYSSQEESAALRANDASQLATLGAIKTRIDEIFSDHAAQMRRSERLVRVLYAKIDGRPDHPWVPGANFKDGALKSALEDLARDVAPHEW